MPETKDRVLRYQIIEDLLTTGVYPADKLLTALCERLREHNTKDISIDQLNIDIRYLRNQGIKILNKRGDGGGYYYEDRNKRFFGKYSDLSKAEKNELEFAIEVLKSKAKLPLVKESIDTINRIAKDIAQERAGDVIMLDNVQGEVKGTEWITELYRVIVEKVNPVLIEYRKFGDTQSKTYTFSPYVLREYKGMWYVVGYNDAGPGSISRIIVLALDRIRQIKVAKHVRFHVDPDFDVHTYFRHIIGIIHKHSLKPQKVKLWVRDFAYNYLEVIKLHHTQKLVEKKKLGDNDGYTIEIDVILSIELQYLLLYWADNIKVIEPVELVQDLKDQMIKMIKNYS
jgi:predicted DNA-binding transcriptional regulator YafY